MIKHKNIRDTLRTFHYSGVNKAGQKVVGSLEARSLTLAKIALRRQEIMINKITQRKNLLLRNKTNKRITASDITVFSRQLATMIESGIPLVQSFDIISQGQVNQNLRHLTNTIKHDLETGLTLATACKKHRRYFNDLFCNLVESGEKAGALDIILNRIAAYKEKITTIKKKIKKALTYPIAVIVIACIVSTGLLIFVVPQFEALFKGFGADLPAMTRFIINLSAFFHLNWFYILATLITLIYLFSYFKKRSKRFAHHVDKVLLKVPIIGIIFEKAAIARFARTLAITFGAGLPLVEALQAVAGSTGNSVFDHATTAIRHEVSTGQQINIAMKNTFLFPDMVIQMIAIGEESGTLEKMVDKVADFYEEEVNNTVDSLSSLLEPVIMCILGVVVGGLIVAMYLPIFQLGAAM